jgi:hypothetical protein
MKIIELLNNYHKKKNYNILKYKSPLAGNQFPGEFNVSGFHKEVIELQKNSKSFWGIDTCLRLKDNTDEFHSNLFNMGIFAMSLDLKNNFSNPFEDERFKIFQKKIIGQFFELLNILKIDFSQIEATYFGGCNIGNKINGRDKHLVKKYSFPTDINSKKLLTKIGIKHYIVNSIKNIDISPIEGALVGPRIEIAFKGIEIATIIFDCFKIKNRKLVPINYVGGYALGIERLEALLKGKNSIIEVSNKLKILKEKLSKKIEAFNSPLLKEDVYTIIYGLEAFYEVDKLKNLTKGQKKILSLFNIKMKKSYSNLGITKNQIDDILKK